MLTPYYTIEDKTGTSGKSLWSRKFLWLRIGCTTSQTVPFHTSPVISRFNPYTDLQRGCFSFGFRGKNYHVRLCK